MGRETIGARLITASLLAILAASVPGFVAPVQAAAISVTTTADETTADGRCSLREAILAANRDQRVDSCRAGKGADLIVLRAATYQLSIAGILEDGGQTGDLDITGPLAIVGAGRNKTFIVGDATDRVFDVHIPAKVGLIALSVVGQADMHLPDGPPDARHGDGGGIRIQGAELSLFKAFVTGNSKVDPHICQFCWSGQGGGIMNEGGRLIVDQSVITGVTAWGGGAIASTGGKLWVSNSELSGEAIEVGGAVQLYGTEAVITRSKITNSKSFLTAVITGGPGGSLIMRQSEISNNLGGLYNSGGYLELADVVIRNNLPTQGSPQSENGPGTLTNGAGVAKLTRVSIIDNRMAEAGGIQNYGEMSIIDSTISGNEGWVGGIDSSLEGSSLTLENTTVSGNRANRDGGGIWMWSGSIRSSTIVSNSAVEGVGGLVLGSGEIANTVIADNVSPDWVVSPDCRGPSYSEDGAITSLGYAFLENGSDCTLSGDTATNILGLDPMLGPLAGNGGSTLTHMPLAGSPLIDTASPLTPGSSNAACPRRDQIGTRRPQDGDGNGHKRCDIGAVERPPASN